MQKSFLGAKTCFTIVGRWYLINLHLGNIPKKSRFFWGVASLIGCAYDTAKNHLGLCQLTLSFAKLDMGVPIWSLVAKALTIGTMWQVLSVGFALQVKDWEHLDLAQGCCRANQEAGCSARSSSWWRRADRGAPPLPEALPPLIRGNASLLVNRIPAEDEVDPAVDGIE